MAIYDVNAIMESEQPEGYVDEEVIEEETEAVLDNMLEACDQMLAALDESTAAQRHYGVTSKNINKITGGIRSVADTKNPIGKMAVKSTAKQIAKGAFDKGTKKTLNAYDKISRVTGSGGLSEREREEAEVVSKAISKGSVGATMARAARAGYDVKGEVDKAKAKAAKKKAIKETCLSILSVIDEL